VSVTWDAADPPRTGRARELVALLVTAGIRATADVRSANPPCVLVEPLPRLTFHASLGGDPAAVWSVIALAPGPGTLAAADTLDALVADVALVLDLDDATPGVYATGISADPLPAYVMTYTEP
jgi:hypothetical protein